MGGFQQEEIDRYGNTWAAGGACNRANLYDRDRYAARVKSVVLQLLSRSDGE